MYSSIKPKTGICIDCNDGRIKRLVAGRCQNHYKSFRAGVRLEAQKEDNDNGELVTWFRERVMEMKGECANCGHPINKYIFKYAVCAVAHIFPKSKFESVKTHPLNWLELGATCGCHSKSELISDAVQMAVWSEMVKRARIIYPFIAPDEIKHIPALLLSEIEKKPCVETHG